MTILVPAQTALDALRARENYVSRSEQTVQPVEYVRPLLSRTSWYIASPAQLAAYLGNLLVREQFDHVPADTVKWTLAMFDVRTMSGAPAVRTIEQIADAVDDYIEDRITPDDVITLRLALASVMSILEPIFGKQLRVTGWLPGFRVAEGRNVLELSGDACPECTINPTGFKVGDKTNVARCLNSEDCGWKSA
ncbi:MAG: hypothetical protein ABWX92_13435 [Mycetocola sp.]